MANRLARESSPYLRQHAHNPVDWYPWGDEAFEKARREDRPVFLSIGYSSCHWCHVMERESFENEEIARTLNEHWVSIKVDREERPDVDDVYMTAVQLMSGRGGWPLSAFLLPDKRPFFAGTYFPPDDRHGRPGFLTVLKRLEAAWRERRADLESGAAELAAEVAAASGLAARGAPESLSPARLGLLGAALTASLRPRPRRLRRRAEVSPAPRARVAPPPGGGRRRRRARDGGGHARRHGVRRHPRPSRRRLSPVFDGRRVAPPALREDAHRQRAASRALCARVRAHGATRRTRASRAAPATTFCARCGERKAASSRGRTRTRREKRESILFGTRAKSVSFSARKRGSISANGTESGRKATFATRRRGASRAVRFFFFLRKSPRPGAEERLAPLRAALLAARAQPRAARPRRQARRGLERARRLGPRDRRPDPERACAILEAARAGARFLLEDCRDAERTASAHVEGRRREDPLVPRGRGVSRARAPRPRGGGRRGRPRRVARRSRRRGRLDARAIPKDGRPRLRVLRRRKRDAPRERAGPLRQGHPLGLRRRRVGPRASRAEDRRPRARPRGPRRRRGSVGAHDALAARHGVVVLRAGDAARVRRQVRIAPSCRRRRRRRPAGLVPFEAPREARYGVPARS